MISGGAGAPSAAQAVRTASRTVSAVSSSPSWRRCPPAGAAPRINRSAAAIPASAAPCARRMPASSAAVLTRRRPSSVSGSTVSLTPAARRRSATATGRSDGTPAASTPHSASARTTTSSSASRRAKPPSMRSKSPSSSMRAKRAPGSTSAIRARSSWLVRTNACPSRSTKRNGSRISSGTSCRMEGCRVVSPYRRIVATA